ncbi:MAG: YigZ family protein [Cyclobacteriaceae bacterium]|nr:YigZ family protein [Ferruginibacter sp.]TXH29451.1 MAG: YigZ family protein [Cyclobacteriaceae bacterium]HNK27712.1 YigZ family protein [Ferruginibacter sp.]HNN71587.1 YigZ family protein [Ferruginibacter sp.]
MTEQDHYLTVDRPATAEFKDRGSKFIAYVYPVETVEAFKQYLQALKKEHPKAVHHCFAYRIGTDGNNFRSSDDGEPSGTAGKPILGQIDSRGVTNTAVIVVRYWGGTLLGVPGLINAYKSAAALALQVTPVIQKQVEVLYSLEFDYTQMNDVMVLLKQFNCTIHANDMQLFCVIKAGIPKNRLADFLYRLNDLHQVSVKKAG